MIHTLPAQPTEIAGDDIDTKQTIQIKAMTPIKMLLPSLSTHSRLTVLCIAKKKKCVCRVCVCLYAEDSAGLKNTKEKCECG